MPNEKNFFTQKDFIHNLNIFLKKNHAPLLDKKGVCSGLSLLYLFHKSRGELDKFNRFINNLARLSEEQANRLANGESIEGIDYTKEELLSIASRLLFTHSAKSSSPVSQHNVKSLLGANLDLTYNMICPNTEEALSEYLTQYLPYPGLYRITSAKHAISITVNSDGSYSVFDPNVYYEKMENLSYEMLPKVLRNMLDSESEFFSLSISAVNFDKSYLEDWFNHATSKLIETAKKNASTFKNTPALMRDLKLIKHITISHDDGQVPTLNSIEAILDIIQSWQTYSIDGIKELTEQLSEVVDYYPSNTQLYHSHSDEHAIKPEARSLNGITILHMAAESGNLKLFKSLIESGMNINIEDDDGLTPLHYAAQHGHMHLLYYMLQIPGLDINTQANTSPLELALEYSQTSFAEQLLVHPDCQTKRKEFSPLSSTLVGSIEHGDLSHIKLLLKAQAPLKVAPNFAHNIIEDDPLFVAVARGNIEATLLLLEAGADPFAKSPKSQRMPIEIIETPDKIRSMLLLQQFLKDSQPKGFFNRLFGIERSFHKHISRLNHDIEINHLRSYTDELDKFYQSLPWYKKLFSGWVVKLSSTIKAEIPNLAFSDAISYLMTNLTSDDNSGLSSSPLPFSSIREENKSKPVEYDRHQGQPQPPPRPRIKNV